MSSYFKWALGGLIKSIAVILIVGTPLFWIFVGFDKLISFWILIVAEKGSLFLPIFASLIWISPAIWVSVIEYQEKEFFEHGYRKWQYRGYRSQKTFFGIHWGKGKVMVPDVIENARGK
jgi:hypothetical protein